MKHKKKCSNCYWVDSCESEGGKTCGDYTPLDVEEEEESAASWYADILKENQDEYMLVVQEFEEDEEDTE